MTVRSGLIHYILDEHGEPKKVDLLTWAKWYYEHHTIKRTELSGHVVCTIFEGLDPYAPWSDRPRLWVTAFFTDEPGRRIGMIDEERSTSHDEAMAVHAAFVERMKAQVQ